MKGEILEDDHLEGAVLIVSGPYGILPQYKLATSKRDVLTQAFVFHKSLVDERHRALAKALIESKAVILFEGCDEEYLYEVLSSTTEDYLMDMVKGTAKGLSIFEVVFDETGDFTLEERD